MILIDTNVLIDVLMFDPIWLSWSAERLEECRRVGPTSFNEVGFAELSARMESEPLLRSAIDELGIVLERMPTAALFAAGRAFHRYRSSGGPRTSVLADFFIGAHAHVAGYAILTRDARRYRTYFPDVRLISP